MVSGTVFLLVMSAFECALASVSDAHARLCVLHLEEDQNNPDIFKQLVFVDRAAQMWFDFLEPSSVSLTCQRCLILNCCGMYGGQAGDL